MKTKEFIKMLQDADPSGEAHIRMSGGVPTYVVEKAGYWDGPYSYIDKDGNWVYTTKGTKVDIYTTDISDFVDEMISTYKIPTWEEVKSKFKFELTYSFEEHRKDREDHILKEAKESYDDMVEMHMKFRVEGERRAIENEENGWSWFQDKRVDDKDPKISLMHHYYTWKVYDKDKKEQGSNPHNVEAVYKSGLFERLDNGNKKGYYQWVLKGKTPPDEKTWIQKLLKK